MLRRCGRAPLICREVPPQNRSDRLFDLLAKWLEQPPKPSRRTWLVKSMLIARLIRTCTISLYSCNSSISILRTLRK